MATYKYAKVATSQSFAYLFQLAFNVIDTRLLNLSSTHFRPFGMALHKHHTAIGSNK